MRKSIAIAWAILITLVVIIAGCGANAQVFRDEMTKTEVTLPADWTIGKENGRTMAFSSDEKTAVFMIREKIPAVALGDLRGKYTLDEYEDIEKANFLGAFKQSFLLSLPGAQEGENGFIKLDNGRTACYVVAHAPNVTAYVVIFIIDQEMIGAIIRTSSSEDFGKKQKDLEKILKSLKADE
jgi:hypothetical protein